MSVSSEANVVSGQGHSSRGNPQDFSRNPNHIFIRQSWSSQSSNHIPSVDTPWNGQFRAVTWNARSVFPNNFLKAKDKKRALSKLLDQFDIVFIQEAHLAAKSVQLAMKVAQSNNMLLFGTIGNQANGGVITFIKQEFMLANFTKAVQSTLAPDRVQKIMCHGPKGTLSLVNAHFFPASEQSIKHYIDLINQHRHELSHITIQIIVPGLTGYIAPGNIFPVKFTM